MFHAPRPLESENNYIDGVLWGDQSYKANVKIKYRGDNYYHWGKRKKSWRINVPNEHLFNGQKRINLVSPKFASHIDNALTYTYAHQVGLLAPLSYFVHARLNGAYLGVMLFVEQVDKYFLMNHRLPEGKIYYFDRGGDWFDSKNWESPGGVFRVQKETEPKELFALTHAMRMIQEDQFEAFSKKIFEVVDREELIKWHAFNTVLGLYHQDSFHNIKMIFDPSRGKFVPVIWDPLLGRSNEKSYFAGDMILSRLLFDPVYQLEKNKMVWKMIHEDLSLSRKLYIAKQMIDGIRPDMYADTLKEYTYTGDSGLRDLTNEKWEEQVIKVLMNIKRRHEYLRKEFSQDVLYANASIKDQSTVLGSLVYKGVAGFDVSWIKIVPKKDAQPLKSMVRVSMFGKTPISYSLEDHRCSKPFMPNEYCLPVQGHIDSKLSFEKFSEEPNHINVPLWRLDQKVDSVSISFDSSEELSKVDNISLIGSNAITQDSRTVVMENTQNVYERKGKHDTPKKHPKKKVITWENTIDLKSTFLVSTLETLIIKPGTTIRLRKDVSLIVEGEVQIQGTKENPIVFESYDLANSWGVVAIVNRSDNFSISHAIFRGGSETTWGLYAFTGMLSVYRSQNVRLDHVSFEKNFGEDALNVKYGNVIGTHLSFQSIYADGFDCDFCILELKNSSFQEIQNDGVDISYARAKILSNTFSRTHDKGISVGERSYAFVQNNHIEQASIGIAVKDESRVVSQHNSLKNNERDFSLYRKKNEFVAGGCLLLNQLRAKKIEVTEPAINRVIETFTIQDVPHKIDRLFYAEQCQWPNQYKTLTEIAPWIGLNTNIE
ncbi:MAG: CotH kinase family protein [Bdellovibrionota bacterium]